MRKQNLNFWFKVNFLSKISTKNFLDSIVYVTHHPFCTSWHSQIVILRRQFVFKLSRRTSARVFTRERVVRGRGIMRVNFFHKKKKKKKKRPFFISPRKERPKKSRIFERVCGLPSFGNFISMQISRELNVLLYHADDKALSVPASYIVRVCAPYILCAW